MSEDPAVPTAIVRGDAPRFDNPREPGAPAGAVVVPIHELYTPRQVVIASFLGGPLGGCWLLARNVRRQGEPRTAQITLAVGAVFTAALVAIAATMGLTSDGAG